MEDQVLASYARARTNNAGRKIVAVRFSPCCRRVRVRTACGAARAPCGGGLARAAGASSQRMRSARHRAAPRDARPASAPSPASITVARVVPSVATSSSRWWRCGHSRSACEQTTNKLTRDTKLQARRSKITVSSRNWSISFQYVTYLHPSFVH